MCAHVHVHASACMHVHMYNPSYCVTGQQVPFIAENFCVVFMEPKSVASQK